MYLLESVLIITFSERLGDGMGKLKLSKRNRSLLLGVASGALCALCVGVYVTDVDRNAAAAQAEMLAQYGGEQIDVCVAKRDIAAGETIADSDIESKTWVVTLLPSNAVTERKDAIGKQVGSTILAGEVISSSRFRFDSAALDVPDGMVAISVPSRDVQSVGGALSPGSIVDIYAVGASSTSKIASSVQVLATSLESTQGSSGSSAWVTIAVEPKRVQELVSAAENLEIYFTMPSDSAVEDGEGYSDDGAGNAAGASGNSSAAGSSSSGDSASGAVASAGEAASAGSAASAAEGSSDEERGL